MYYTSQKNIEPQIVKIRIELADNRINLANKMKSADRKNFDIASARNWSKLVRKHARTPYFTLMKYLATTEQPGKRNIGPSFRR